MAIASASTPVALTNSAASVGIGQQLIHIQLAFGAMAVFLTHFSCFQRTQTTQLTLNRYTAGVRHLNNGTTHINIVLKRRWCLAVGSREPSIITELKPDWIERRQIAGEEP